MVKAGIDGVLMRFLLFGSIGFQDMAVSARRIFTRVDLFKFSVDDYELFGLVAGPM